MEPVKLLVRELGRAYVEEVAWTVETKSGWRPPLLILSVNRLIDTIPAALTEKTVLQMRVIRLRLHQLITTAVL